MKAGDIFALAARCLSEEPARSAAVAAHAPGWLTTLCAEALPFENALRQYERSEGKAGDAAAAELEAAPVIESLEDEVPYAAALCVPALVWGLASQLFLDDENDARAQEFRNRYVVALHEAVRIAEGRVVDLY